jgi:hypothetical protein
MKMILACVCASAAFTASIAIAQEALLAAAVAPKADDNLYDIRPIKSLDELQGYWSHSPKGEVLQIYGHTLDIKGTRGRFRGVHLRGQQQKLPKMPDEEVGLELVGGALRLKSDSPDVPKGKWRLAQFGEYRCLFRFASMKREEGPQPIFYAETIYFQAPEDGERAEVRDGPPPNSN